MLSHANQRDTQVDSWHILGYPRLEMRSWFDDNVETILLFVAILICQTIDRIEHITGLKVVRQDPV
jgi:hypothetical protein